MSIAEAPAHGESIITYSPKSKGAKEFLAFINELIEPHKMNKSKKTVEEK
ncbi:MAG: ParA family protein [Oscillospiraceae bacterium]